MDCLKPFYLVNRDMYVPCGKCVYCCQTRANAWAARLYWESRDTWSSAFVTLTYEEKYLTIKKGVSQLNMEDLQKYFKRLRKAGLEFRYYAVGEYGTRYGRPHFHILFFFRKEPDLEIVREKWGMGIVHIGSVTPASVNYCLTYISLRKKRYNRVYEFATMSKKLGATYLSKQMIAWHKDGRKNYSYVDGKKVALARYYKDKIFSKLDRLRIAVAVEKESFQKMLRFIRGPEGRKLRDPLERYERSRLIQASLMLKSKKLQKEHVSF